MTVNKGRALAYNATIEIEDLWVAHVSIAYVMLYPSIIIKQHDKIFPQPYSWIDNGWIGFQGNQYGLIKNERNIKTDPETKLQVAMIKGERALSCNKSFHMIIAVALHVELMNKNIVGNTIISGATFVIEYWRRIKPSVPRMEAHKPIVFNCSLFSNLRRRPKIVVKIGFKSIQGAVNAASDSVSPKQNISCAIKTPIKPDSIQRRMCLLFHWRKISSIFRTVKVHNKSITLAPTSAWSSKNI